MQEDMEQMYIKIINELNISLVFVGIRFLGDTSIPCISLYDNNLSAKLIQNQSPNILRFIDQLRQNTKAKVYGSSVCCLEKNSGCAVKLYEYDLKWCEDCSYFKSLCTTHVE